jgi:type IV secretory pathway VirB10-like protein
MPAPQLARSRAPLVIGVCAVLAVAGAVVFAMTRDDGEPAKPPAIAGETVKPAAQRIVVEPIPPDPVPAAVPDVSAPPPPAPAPVPVPVPVKIAHTVTPSHRHADTKRIEHTAAAPKPELTKELVGGKLRAAAHEYEAYKAKNGPRFDQEWNDLASFSTYHGSELEDLSRRIDAFRAKLRE